MTVNCDNCGKEFPEGETVYQITSGQIENGEFVENGDRTIHCEGCV